MLSMAIQLPLHMGTFKQSVYCCSFVRSYSTSNERAVGIGVSQHAAAAAAGRKKRKKHRQDVDEAHNSKKCSRKHCDAKTAKATGVSLSVCDCETSLRDLEMSPVACRRRCRGWFTSSWPQTNDACTQSLSASDQTLCRVTETVSQRAQSQLVNLHLESSSAAKWLAFKQSRREDHEALLSSPAGVLWRGRVKPLIQPSQATSVGKMFFFKLFITICKSREVFC